jgi:hypothetical protein
MENWRTLNVWVIENFITFLTDGRTQDFDSEARSYAQLKLVELKRYDFQFKLIFKFLSVLIFIRFNGPQSSSYSCTCVCEIMKNAAPIRSSPKDFFCQIYMVYV